MIQEGDLLFQDLDCGPLCDAIEAEARALVEADGEQRSPFLLLAQSHWHHGVIGIVAARLVEHFGLPVALLAALGS